MVNKVFLIGNLGRDPEVRHTKSGQPVANLNLTTSRRVKDANGNWGEQTEWHTVVCFGRTAELAGQYLQKGRRIFVEGRLQTRSWDDRDGKKQYRTEVVAEEVKFLDSRGGESRGGYGGGERPAYEGDPGPDDSGYGAGGDDDDIPF